MNAVVVLHPAIDEQKSCSGIRDQPVPHIVTLEGLTKASAMPLLSGLSTGVKHATRFSAKAISRVRWAAKIEPYADRPLRPRHVCERAISNRSSSEIMCPAERHDPGAFFLFTRIARPVSHAAASPYHLGGGSSRYSVRRPGEIPSR